jgi:hypothetical protein
MPRAQTSLAGRILVFFRTAPIDTAKLVLDLARDAVQERAAKSDAAKARATGAPATATAAAPKKGKAKKAKAKAPQAAASATPVAPAAGSVVDTETAASAQA